MSYFGITGTESSVNSTTANIAESDSFVGEWEIISNYASIAIIANADFPSMLYADFSIDGVTTDRAVQLSGGENGNLGIHSLIPVSKYFRIRVVNLYAGVLTNVRVQTTYHKVGRIAQPTSRLGQNLTEYSDVLNTRTVLSSTSGLNVRVTDHEALQVTFPEEGKSAFGEALMQATEHEFAAAFVYGINSGLVTPFANNTGSVTSVSGMAKISTGAVANSAANIVTVDTIKYQPGLGARGRFTAVFTSGVAGSTQIAGIGTEGNGFFFGYNGSSFGILHRRNGQPEVETLTITTPSTTAENITITLNGQSTGDVVTVSNSNNATTTANEIAAYDYSNVGSGWNATAVGNTVVFTAKVAGPQTSGAFSLSGATTAVGTFAENLRGVDTNETWIPQASWNGIDTFDGNGPAGVVLDPTKGNVYQITYQWLGFGRIAFYVEDPDDGEYHLVHSIPYANINLVPSVANPSLPITIEARNFANTSALSVYTASLGGFVDGKRKALGPRRGSSASKTLSTANLTPVLTIRNKEIFNSRINRSYVKIILMSASVEHTKPVRVIVYANAKLTGASFTDVSTSQSSVQIDTSATTMTGGIELFAVSLGKSGNTIIDVSSEEIAGLIPPGGSLTFAAIPTSQTGADVTVGTYYVDLI